MEAVSGVTAIAVKAALVTVRAAPEETPPEVATMVETPSAIPIASPCVPFTLIPATEGFTEVHCADAVKFCVLPSVKVPLAVNCTVVPSAADALPGETASERRLGAVTVNVALPLTPENAAAIVVDPGALLAAIPVPEIVAAFVFDELQVAEFVRFFVVWSLYVPVAVNCCESPAEMEGV